MPSPGPHVPEPGVLAAPVGVLDDGAAPAGTDGGDGDHPHGPDVAVERVVGDGVPDVAHVRAAGLRGEDAPSHRASSPPSEDVQREADHDGCGAEQEHELGDPGQRRREARDDGAGHERRHRDDGRAAGDAVRRREGDRVVEVADQPRRRADVHGRRYRSPSITAAVAASHASFEAAVRASYSMPPPSSSALSNGTVTTCRVRCAMWS